MGFRFFVIGALALAISGCSSASKEPEKEIQLPPDTLYKQGVVSLKKKRYSAAHNRFQEVDQKHPFSPWATRSQLNIIYAYYMKEEFDEAVSASTRFIRLHPRHKHAAYAYYMRGMGHYQRITDAYRDQGHTKKAIGAFKELMSRFPSSDYAWKAEQMITLCNDRLAEQEMVVARYYLDRSEYIPAMNRFQKIVKKPEFSRTPYVEEALFSMALAAMRLGLREEARNYTAVLGHNFSKGKFYSRMKGILKSDDDISKNELRELRRSVNEGNLMQRFMEGLKPGMPGMGGLGGLGG